MLRIGRAPAPLTLGMLRLGPESQHPTRERQPLARESQHTGCISEHIGIMRRLPSLDWEHNVLGRLPQAVQMLRNPGIFLLRKPGMLRLGGESQHPAGGAGRLGAVRSLPPGSGMVGSGGRLGGGSPSNDDLSYSAPSFPLRTFAAITSRTPSGFFRTSWFQNLSTRNPCSASQASRASSRASPRCCPPSISITSLCRKLAKSTMYGPIGTCRRKRAPRDPPRSSRQSRRSASVMFCRRSRAWRVRSSSIMGRRNSGRFYRRREHRGCWGSPPPSLPPEPTLPLPGGRDPPTRNK